MSVSSLSGRPAELALYQRNVKTFRVIWSGCRDDRLKTKDRHKKEPRWYAVTWCPECDELGLTSEKRGKGVRFACKICLVRTSVLWVDRPDELTLDDEDQAEEWADWVVSWENKKGSAWYKLRIIVKKARRTSKRKTHSSSASSSS